MFHILNVALRQSLFSGNCYVDGIMCVLENVVVLASGGSAWLWERKNRVYTPRVNFWMLVSISFENLHRLVLWCVVLFCLDLSYVVLPCLGSCLVLCWLILTSFVLSCFALSWVLSCFYVDLSCLGCSCLVLLVLDFYCLDLSYVLLSCLVLWCVSRLVFNRPLSEDWLHQHFASVSRLPHKQINQQLYVISPSHFGSFLIYWPRNWWQ